MSMAGSVPPARPPSWITKPEGEPIKLAETSRVGLSLAFGDDAFPLRVNVHAGERASSAAVIMDHHIRRRATMLDKHHKHSLTKVSRFVWLGLDNERNNGNPGWHAARTRACFTGTFQLTNSNLCTTGLFSHPHPPCICWQRKISTSWCS